MGVAVRAVGVACCGVAVDAGMGGCCAAVRRLWEVGGALSRAAGGGGAGFLTLADGGGGRCVLTVV